MKFNATIVAVDAKSAVSKAGKSYQLVDIAYKNNTFQGKIESQKINQYSPIFKQAAAMQAGQTYDIEKEKDASGYYQWNTITQGVPGSVVSQPQVSTNPVANKVSTNYETKEERARKQVLIVKQSSLAQAIAACSIGAKTPPSRQTILEEAQAYTDWVFEDKPLSMDDLTKLPNDIDMQVD